MVKFNTVNPADGSALAQYETVSAAQLRDVLLRSRVTQKNWGGLTVMERIAYFSKLISSLEQSKGELSAVTSREVGKPLKESIAEVERCKIPLEYFRTHGERLLADEFVTTDAAKSYIRFEPIGLVAAFTPWNYPLWGIFRQLAPALLCGNSLLVRPSLKTAGSASAAAEAVKNAGLPDGLFQVVLGNEEITEPLIAGVEAVVAISSPRLGRTVAEIAGRHMKRVNLQLSGSDPFIVLEDCDVKYVARRAAASRLFNAGQDCVSAKRFIIRQEVYSEFCGNIVAEMERVVPGNPLDQNIAMGPVGDKKLLGILTDQVEDAVQKGAILLSGGTKLSGDGYFFPPTVLGGVTSDMRVWQEETFGPVAAIMSVENDEKVVNVANDSPFGLGASVWTKDLMRGETIARSLEAGLVTVNEQPKSNPAMPFGGLKQTGMGRDFSKYGLLHFLNTKSVFLFDAQGHQK